MNKAAQVRAIYHELRQVMGDRATSQEVLRCANSLVELFSTECAGPQCDMRTGGVPFENWSLNAALSDGGWRVFWYEMHRGTDFAGVEWEGMPVDLLEGQFNLEAMICQM